MTITLIKHYNIRALLWVLAINILPLIIFIILGGVLIQDINFKITYLSIALGINLISLLIIYGFSKSNDAYQTVYQIDDGFDQNYQYKLWRYFLIIFGIAWIMFFITVAIFMFAESAINHVSIDYFKTLKKEWWVILIITSYHVLLFLIHRFLSWIMITNNTYPFTWFKTIKQASNTNIE